MELEKRHDITDTTFSRVNLLRTSCELVVCMYVADFLRTCYGETGVMDFGFNAWDYIALTDEWTRVMIRVRGLSDIAR